MGALLPISKTDKRSKGLAVTADKHGRLCLSAELQKEFELVGKDDLYLYFDEQDRRIGIGRSPAGSEHTPYRFDKRGYTYAEDFLDRCGIDSSEQSIKFVYEGTERGVLVFRQLGIKRPKSFKQDRNGNLEVVRG
ncbi:hypothetical protein [Paenibacillus flagellatus]|uniref:Uncharacterized protein n=1 Tax=Paenibacillus flagellatus TaxID=2211139 RepID=A0A2V5KBU7_9BACL|nr:hypothetical protein [Paenibacillus flagellatus]PYI57041.1 hypothetical protein DLM86_00910 [Paenibacillus flagellatus]